MSMPVTRDEWLAYYASKRPTRPGTRHVIAAQKNWSNAGGRVTLPVTSATKGAAMMKIGGKWVHVGANPKPENRPTPTPPKVIIRCGKVVRGGRDHRAGWSDDTAHYE